MSNINQLVLEAIIKDELDDVKTHISHKLRKLHNTEWSPHSPMTHKVFKENLKHQHTEKKEHSITHYFSHPGFRGHSISASKWKDDKHWEVDLIG